MEIKVKYCNGKLHSNNKEIILNNVADIHEIAMNVPSALSTKIFYGIIKDVDGKKGIFLIAPVRSLVDDDVIYLYFSPDMQFATALFRGLGTSMLHIGCTALFLVLWLLAKNNSRKPFFRFWGIIPCLLIHALHNLHYFQPLIQMVAVVVIFLVVFLCVSNYNEKCIGKWLDLSMMNDIDLLSAIKEGTLPDTKAGEYLMSVKEQFDPYVFLDMICYVQLYLELTITGKSRMMLRESGLLDEESEEEKAQYKAMLKEFDTLRGNIGKMGEIILRPIVKMTDEDKKLIGVD